MNSPNPAYAAIVVRRALEEKTKCLVWNPETNSVWVELKLELQPEEVVQALITGKMEIVI